MIDNDDLIISIYVSGTNVNSFRVGHEGRHPGFGIIAVYTTNDTSVYSSRSSGMSFSGLYNVEVADGELKLKSTFTLLSSGQYLTTNQVIGDIWKSHILPYIEERTNRL